MGVIWDWAQAKMITVKQSLFCCIALILSLQVSSNEAAAKEVTFVMQRSFAPFNYAENDVPKGPAVDIVYKVCGKLGWQCNIKVLPWVRAQEETKAGENEAIFTVGWNEARDKWLYYTYPLMETEYGFFARAEDSKTMYKGVEDLQGKNIIVYGPSNTSKRLEKLKVLAEKEGVSFEIDIDVNNKSTIKCNIKVLPWVRAQEKTKAGENEAIFTVGWNEARDKWLYYTYPLMETEYGFFARAEDSKTMYKGVEDLQGKNIIVYGPSNTSKRLEKLKVLAEKEGVSFEIDIDVNNKSTIKRLAGERGDLLFSNRDVGRALAEKEGKESVVSYIGHAFPPYHYYIGFSRNKSGNFELFSKFNLAYKKLVESGEITRLLEDVNQTLGNHEKGSIRTHFKM